jgi:integrase
MASLVTRTRKDGTPSYFVKYRSGDGKVRWEQFEKAKAAQARKAEVELALVRSGGAWHPPIATSFEEYARAWLETYAAQAVRPRVLAGYRKAVEDFVALFVARTLTALTRSDVKAFVASKLAEGYAPGSVRNRLVPLRELLGHAVEDGLIVANPAAGLRIPQGDKRKLAPPSREEVERLLAHTRPEAVPALAVAAACGLRRGELFALRWADVDFEAGTIHVHASNYGAQVSETPKSEAGERFVPLFASARTALAETKLRSRFNRDSDLVFSTAGGTRSIPATSSGASSSPRSCARACASSASTTCATSPSRP